MIVKNEAAVICRCLASVREVINYWVICDTGSTDGTPEVLREALKGIPGELHETSWVDFAWNRTQAIRQARGKADYHLMLDQQSDAIFATTDQLAERVRKLGGTTVRSISQIAKLQTIEDNNEEYVPPREMLRELMEDNKHMAAAMRKAHKLCDEHEDSGSASLLEVFIDETERRTWFLFEASRQEGANEA